jgi:hypothetical protein
MSERPFPKGWKAKVNGFKDALAKRAAERPDLRISVAPKGPRASGPHPAGDTRHQEPEQDRMELAAQEGDPCADCGTRVLKSSGPLIRGLYCGKCWGLREATSDPLNAA